MNAGKTLPENIGDELNWAIGRYDKNGHLLDLNASMRTMLAGETSGTLSGALDIIFGTDVALALQQHPVCCRLALSRSRGICRVKIDDVGEARLLLVEALGETGEQWALREVFTDLIKHLPEPVGVSSGDYKAIFANEAARRMVRIQDDDQLRQIDVTSLRPDASEVSEALRLSRERGPVHISSALMLSVDGQHRQEVDQTIMCHQDAVLGAEYYSCISRDVSDRLKMQLALEQSSNELKHSQNIWNSVVKRNHNLVLMTDGDGNIVFCNQGFLDNASPLMGQCLYDLVRQADREGVVRLSSQILSGDLEHGYVEAIMHCSDGDEHRCIWLANRLQHSDGSVGATWIITDISREHAIRQRAIAAEKLVATGRMAARIAHEINNPLAGIKGAIALIKLDFPADHVNYEYVNMVEKEINRLSNIVRQMYGLFKPEMQAVSRIDLLKILRECQILMQPLAIARNIGIVLGDMSPIHVYLEETRLREIIYNLLRNAIEASFDNGSIIVSAWINNNCAHIAIDDEGRGLPTEKDAIFEPFFTTKQTFKGAGLGLGLSVSRSLANAMGGEVSLTPRQPRGTRALLCLPLSAGMDDQGHCEGD